MIEREPGRSQERPRHIGDILSGVIKDMRPSIRMADVTADDLLGVLAAAHIVERGLHHSHAEQLAQTNGALAEASAGHLDSDGVFQGDPEEIDDYLKKMSEVAREFEI